MGILGLNLKVTSMEDLVVASVMLAERPVLNIGSCFCQAPVQSLLSSTMEHGNVQCWMPTSP